MARTSSSLKELRSLREAVVAEEKAKTQARLQNLPENLPPAAASVPAPPPPSPPPSPSPPPPPPSLSPELSVEVAEPAVEWERTALADSLPSLPEAPVVQPAPPKPTIVPAPAPAPAPPPAPVRSKPGKDLTLIIPLTPRIQERLQRHVENARWSPSELVMELIRVTLHQGYPAIEYNGELIAKAGTFRAFERNPVESVLKIVSGQGVFSVQVNSESQDYQHWLKYFTNQQAAEPEKSATQVCLFNLQSYLENVEDFKLQDWTKNIQPDTYRVTPAS